MTTTLDYPFPDLPALGAAVQLVPGLAWLRMPLPFALDHINLWLLDGRRLTRSVCTHGHPDHLGLAKWLESEFGAPLWITQGEYLLAQLLVAQAGPFTTATMIAFFARHGLDAERLAAHIEAAVGGGDDLRGFRLGDHDLGTDFRRHAAAANLD